MENISDKIRIIDCKIEKCNLIIIEQNKLKKALLEEKERLLKENKKVLKN